MNLGKLLGAGKTFFGGGGKVAYREDKKFNLPKFNADKNPFAPKPADAAPAAPEVKKVSPSPVASAKKAPAFVILPPNPAMPTRAASWKDKLNPFRAPEPVRALMRMLSAASRERSDMSVNAIWATLDRLKEGDAGFFAANPALENIHTTGSKAANRNASLANAVIVPEKDGLFLCII